MHAPTISGHSVAKAHYVRDHGRSLDQRAHGAEGLGLIPGRSCALLQREPIVMWRYAGMADRIVTIRWPTPSAWVVVASEDAVAGGARWAVAAALAACTATKSTGQRSTSTSPTATSSRPASGGGATSSSSSAAPAPARVTLLPASGTAGVSPIAPISASVSGGTL